MPKIGSRRFVSTICVLCAPLLCILFIAVKPSSHQHKDLPRTPQVGFASLVKAMSKQDVKGIELLATSKVLGELSSYKGEVVTKLYVYDYLVEHGISRHKLQMPWGLWQQWALNVASKPVRTVSENPSSSRVSTSLKSGDDGLTFIWSHTPEGWLLTSWNTSAAKNLSK